MEDLIQDLQKKCFRRKMKIIRERTRPSGSGRIIYGDNNTPHTIFISTRPTGADLLHEYYHGRDYQKGKGKLRTKTEREFFAEKFTIRVLNRFGLYETLQYEIARIKDNWSQDREYGRALKRLEQEGLI
jgi:hypothetical protein